jgi:GT2 family glycosyltransferase
MRRRFEEDPGLSLCYTDAWILDPQTGRIGTATAMQWQRRAETPPADPAAFLLELLHRNFIYSAAVVRRSVIDEIGGFDENLPAAIDYEMWLRIVAHGHRAGQVSGLHAVYRRERPGSISSNSKRTFASLAVVFKKVADEYDVPAEAKVLARERTEVMQRELAALDGRLGLNSIWRARARPALVFLRNAVLRRDRWRRVPPPELAEAFPSLLRPPGQGRAPGL